MRAILIALPVLAGLATAANAAGGADPFTLCAPIITGAERSAHLPPQLLQTIGIVETGRRNPRSGVYAAWPWTINAEGTGTFFDTKEQAIAAVQALQARGVRSIDIGCMQVNLMFHPDAFGSLNEAFDPRVNVAYAARFLQSLYVQTNDWPKAAAAYHSQTPEIGANYGRQVMALWPLAPRFAAQEAPKTELGRLLLREAADREQIYAGMRGASLPGPRAGSLRGRGAPGPTLLADVGGEGMGWHSLIPTHIARTANAP